MRFGVREAAPNDDNALVGLRVVAHLEHVDVVNLAQIVGQGTKAVLVIEVDVVQIEHFENLMIHSFK